MPYPDLRRFLLPPNGLRPAGLPRWGRWGLVVCGLGLLATPGARSLEIRINPLVIVQEDADRLPVEDTGSAVLHASEEATTLRARAEEAILRPDWKLAIDSLQRMIEMPGEHVLSADGRVFESARRLAHRRIGSLPPEGLAAYRLLYDGEASALLRRAEEHHDPSLVQSIVERYACTRVGDDAAALLADWLIDEGRFAEAAGLLRRMQGLCPDSDLPPWAIPSRLAVCAAALGQRQRAERLFESLATTRPADPAGRDERLEARRHALAAYIARPDTGRALSSTGSWSAAFGGPARNGRMPAVAPHFLTSLPGTVELPMKEPRDGYDAVLEYARDRSLFPVRELVTDGTILLVKGERELLALDADNFAPVWTSRPAIDEADLLHAVDPARHGPGAVIRRDRDRRLQSEVQMQNDPLVRRLAHDSVGGGVAIAFGMALTVEWVGDPPLIIAPSPGEPVLLRGGPFDAETEPNHVLAYRLADGRLLWKSDTTGTEESGAGPAGLGPVEFLALPIPVDGALLAPARVGSDLYAIVLDAKTGRMIRHVYLCGTGGGAFDSLSALAPCEADGVVYLPTGRGVIIAMDVSEWSVQWAVRYDRRSHQGGREGAWTPTPVIAVADVVLLAPGDADDLLCLDRGTGETRWRLPREDFTHVLGATDRHVWLAGKDVQLVEVETGRPVWRRSCGAASGRGVVAGDRIYIPTTGGLVAFAALTGEPISIDQPTDPLPLGNLLAWDASLYSVSFFQMRRFMDFEQGYAQALARHEEKPADPARAIRLAWLELARHEPARALDALGKLPASLKEDDARQYAQVVHLRVMAMLELAASEEMEAASALKLLEEARLVAESPQDAIQSTLALGDFLRRQGRLREASQHDLSLVLSEQGDQLVSQEQGLEQRARGLALRRIAEMAGEWSAVDAEAFENQIRLGLREAAAGRNVAALSWLAESPALGSPADEANLLLGTSAARDMRYEQAEICFSRVLRHADSPELIAEATARLAAIYLEPDELHQPAAAWALLDRLSRGFAQVTLPADILETEPDASGAQRPERVPAGRIAAKLRERIDSAMLARHRAAMAPVNVGPPGAAHVDVQPEARPLTLRGARTEPLADKTLVLVGGNRVEAQNVSDGRALWPAELRLLGELAVEQRPALAVMPGQVIYPAETVQRARGVADGQTLIVNSEFGLHAIGLLTGRRLWSRRFDPPCRADEQASGADTWVWAHDGFVATVDHRRRLEVAATHQGDRILWRCTMPQRKWRSVRIRGHYVVAVDEALENVDVFRLADGQRLGQCRFVQDASPGGTVNLTLYDDVICGPVGPNEAAAVELATPGVHRWRVSMPAKLSQLFKPTPDLVAVADRAGRVKLLDPTTGREQMTVQSTEACRDGIVDGALIDGVLYVCGYSKRPAAAADMDQQEWGLAAIDAGTHHVLWERGGFGAWTYLSAEVLQASGNGIPVAVLKRSSGQAAGELRQAGSPPSAGTVELTILGKKDGQVIGEKAEADLRQDGSAKAILDVQVWPGKVLVFTGVSRLAFPFSAEKGLARVSGPHRDEARDHPSDVQARHVVDARSPNAERAQ